MSWRTVIVSNQAKLDYKMGYLVVRGEETVRILVDEISVLLIENPAISITGYLMEALIENKTKVIFCDERHNPVGEVFPHHGSHDSASKIRSQICWSKDVKALIWQEIISEKIRQQSAFLMEIGKLREAELINSYLGQVELFDTTNREGHAAKVYFNALFGKGFTRSEECPRNAALNYGYSIILSLFNREIAANGYITQLGIFHDNMFNHFNLACDLMEPFRIIVDRFVYPMKLDNFDKDEKHELWCIMDIDILINNTIQSLSNAIRIYVHSVFDAINDTDPSLIKFYKFLEIQSAFKL